MNTMKSLAVEEALQDAYKTLSACYHDPSEQTLPETLQNFATRLTPLGQETAEQAKSLTDSFLQSDQQDLLIDFARLFVGPFEVLAPPFGSYYLDNQQMMGESTVEVKEFYEKAGLEISESFNNLPDHIAAELEILYYLVFNEIHACQSENEKSAQWFRDLRFIFTERHIGQWADAFAANIDQHARFTFYKELAKITCMVLNAQREGELSP